MTGKVASGNNSTLAMRNRAAIPLDITTESSEGDILPLSLMTNQYTDLQGFLFTSSTTNVRWFYFIHWEHGNLSVSLSCSYTGRSACSQNVKIAYKFGFNKIKCIAIWYRGALLDRGKAITKLVIGCLQCHGFVTLLLRHAGKTIITGKR